jgi:hypothetical protein
MKWSRITDDMFARMPTLLVEGATKAEIAAMYGVTLGILTVPCSGAAYRCAKAGHCLRRTNLALPANRCHLATAC